MMVFSLSSRACAAPFLRLTCAAGRMRSRLWGVSVRWGSGQARSARVSTTVSWAHLCRRQEARSAQGCFREVWRAQDRRVVSAYAGS